MRKFTLISSWLLWSLCAFTVMMFTIERAWYIPPAPRQPPKDLTRFTNFIWASLAMFTAFSVCLYLLRRQFWFSSKRKVGIVFWLLTFLFYISILLVSSSGFAPFFVGDRSSLQWASCGLGLIFLIVGFPKLSALPEINPGNHAEEQSNALSNS